MKFNVKSNATGSPRRVRADASPATAASQPPTYRRNRTMTDRSTVPEVSERARIHHLRAVRRKIGLLMLGVVAIGSIVGIGVGEFSGSVHVISQSDVNLSRKIDESVYRGLFDTYFARHPFDRFRFITDTKQLTDHLQEGAPEVSGIESYGFESIGVSQYEISVRKPVASWTVDGKKYYVDAEGATFQKNYYAEPKVSVIDNSGAEIVQGAAIASNRLLSFVGRVVSLSSSKHITVTSIEIPTNSMRQLNVKGRGIPTIKMTIDKTVEGQVGDMVEAINYFKRKKESPGYIDVRAPGRAYYK